MKSTLLLLTCAFTGSVVAQSRKNLLPSALSSVLIRLRDRPQTVHWTMPSVCAFRRTMKPSTTLASTAFCKHVAQMKLSVCFHLRQRLCIPTQLTLWRNRQGSARWRKFCAAATAQAKTRGASRTATPTATGPATGVVTGNTTSVVSTRSSTGQATGTSAPGAGATDAPERALGLLVAGLLAAL
ncbi:hypothetical protein MAC_09785 [Metarhizium acridum CQMa 102]|uniref:Uncharacterized protein n=1 Tax=Metarhizium acridum (strain CQMa 102) TaxID=655827 RepID=E9EIT7_METAQ|nr:uncharacterized protein MAC_09785 [Metarhizium acridum CQMa 102]EFY84171.1 hypothetical protein MAC_09785 [Metarhizium acridum CQMa 102]